MKTLVTILLLSANALFAQGRKIQVFPISFEKGYNMRDRPELMQSGYFTQDSYNFDPRPDGSARKRSGIVADAIGLVGADSSVILLAELPSVYANYDLKKTLVVAGGKWFQRYNGAYGSYSEGDYAQLTVPAGVVVTDDEVLNTTFYNNRMIIAGASQIMQFDGDNLYRLPLVPKAYSAFQCTTVTGGSLSANTTYYYAISYTNMYDASNSAEESPIGQIKKITTTTTQKSVRLFGFDRYPPNLYSSGDTSQVLAINIYRGESKSSLRWLTSIDPTQTSYLDDGSLSTSLTAAPPWQNQFVYAKDVAEYADFLWFHGSGYKKYLSGWKLDAGVGNPDDGWWPVTPPLTLSHNPFKWVWQTSIHHQTQVGSRWRFTITNRGDANEDGAVDSLDVKLIYKYAGGVVTADSLNLENADVNLDGVVDSTDGVLALTSQWVDNQSPFDADVQAKEVIVFSDGRVRRIHGLWEGYRALTPVNSDLGEWGIVVDGNSVQSGTALYISMGNTLMQVDDEIFAGGWANSSELYVPESEGRGLYGTSKAAHAAGTPIYIVRPWDNSNELYFSYIGIPTLIYNLTDPMRIGMVDDPIVKILSVWAALLVVKKHSIYRIEGTSPDNFQVIPMSREIGAASPRAVVPYKSGAVLLNEGTGDLYYVGAGGAQTINISQMLGDVIADSAETGYVDDAALVFYNNKFYLAIVKNGTTKETDVYVYDALYNTFTRYTGWHVKVWGTWTGTSDPSERLYWGDWRKGNVYKVDPSATSDVDSAGNAVNITAKLVTPAYHFIGADARFLEAYLGIDNSDSVRVDVRVVQRDTVFTRNVLTLSPTNGDTSYESGVARQWVIPINEVGQSLQLIIWGTGKGRLTVYPGALKAQQIGIR